MQEKAFFHVIICMDVNSLLTKCNVLYDMSVLLLV